MPRAMIHKHILEVAADHPEASLEEIAGTVSGASIGLVEQVLDEYGDPHEPDQPAGQHEDSTPQAPATSSNSADTDGDAAGHPSDRTAAPAEHGGAESMETDTMTATDPAPADIEATDLTEKQRETIEAIYEDPDASQGDLAERLGVSRATICQRVNGIDGFDWADREAFADAVVGNGADPAAATPTAELEAVTRSLEDLGTRLDALERRLEPDGGPRDAIFDDPELTHKVIQACVHADQISEDEELSIIAGLLGHDDR